MLDIAIAAPQRHDRLTIYPLVAPGAAELPYALLADALEAGSLTITEVGSGTVPRLLAANDGAADVLIVDGEQLVGARQNRMTNRTILLPAKSTTEIPVSCMERGRWHFASDEMKPTSHHSPANVRRHARRAEAAFAAAGMPAPEEALAHAQGDVWSEIDDYAAALRVDTGTGALDALYDSHAAGLEEWTKAFPAVPGQVGMLAFVGTRPIALDVIGGHTLYARLHGRLVRGYIMDAMAIAGTPDPRTATGPATPPPDAPQRFLDRAREAVRVDAPTAGRGRYRVLAGDVIGSQLEDDDRLVHLCAFPAEDDRPGGRPDAAMTSLAGPPLPPPSRRRRLR